MSSNKESISIAAAILTFATIYRRMEPPEQDDPEGALKTVLTTYDTIHKKLISTAEVENHRPTP